MRIPLYQGPLGNIMQFWISHSSRVKQTDFCFVLFFSWSENSNDMNTQNKEFRRNY